MFSFNINLIRTSLVRSTRRRSRDIRAPYSTCRWHIFVQSISTLIIVLHALVSFALVRHPLVSPGKKSIFAETQPDRRKASVSTQPRREMEALSAIGSATIFLQFFQYCGQACDLVSNLREDRRGNFYEGLFADLGRNFATFNTHFRNLQNVEFNPRSYLNQEVGSRQIL